MHKITTDKGNAKTRDDQPLKIKGTVSTMCWMGFLANYYGTSLQKSTMYVYSHIKLPIITILSSYNFYTLCTLTKQYFTINLVESPLKLTDLKYSYYN